MKMKQFDINLSWAGYMHTSVGAKLNLQVSCMVAKNSDYIGLKWSLRPVSWAAI